MNRSPREFCLLNVGFAKSKRYQVIRWAVGILITLTPLGWGILLAHALGKGWRVDYKVANFGVMVAILFWRWPWYILWCFRHEDRTI